MTYLPTAEHDELRAVVRELADERIAPRAAEIDGFGIGLFIQGIADCQRRSLPVK